MLQETQLVVGNLIKPLFLVEGNNVKEQFPPCRWFIE